MWAAKERQGAQMPPGYFDKYTVAKHKRVRERSKGASPNLTKHKTEVQSITTRGREAAWVDDLLSPP